MTTATPTQPPAQPEMSEADHRAHELASYVRPKPEPTPDLPPLPPSGTTARRRAIAQRRW
jgi:hypothetical protein